MQPVTPSLWRRAGQVLLSFFAFALIICAFPPFVNPPGCAWMQFAVSLVPRSHCEVAIPCSPRGSSSAPAAGRRTACPPQVRALRLLPPHWGWRPRSPRFIVFPEKGRTLPLPPANGGTPSSPCRLAPAPAAGNGADCSPQVRIAPSGHGPPPQVQKKWPCVLQSHCFRFFKSLPARCFRKSAGRLAASCAPGGGAPAGRRSSDGDRSWRTRTYRGSKRR